MGFFSRMADKTVNQDVHNRRRKILIIFIAVITLLSMTTATVAWFTVNTLAGVSQLDLHISMSAQLKVSMDDHGTDLDQYVKVITNEMIDNYLARNDTSLSNIMLDPVTTSDGRSFVSQRGTSREPNNRTYLEFECYFIATEDMWVELTTESTQQGLDDGTKVTTTSTGARADVVNCTRVSFTADNSPNSTAIYEPNRGYPINNQTTFDLPSGTMVYSDETRLFHLNQLEPTKVTIRIWIDGEDPECDDDVQDAQLSIQLGFVGCDENNQPIA